LGCFEKGGLRNSAERVGIARDSSAGRVRCFPEPEKGILDTARSLREDYLQQSAYDEVDTYTSVRKQYLMLSAILEFGRMEADAIRKGVRSSGIGNLDVRKLISKMKWTPEDQVEQLVKEIRSSMTQQFESLVIRVTR